MSKLFTDYFGKKFGDLTVLSFDSYDKYGHIKFLCLCSCGTTTVVLKYNLDAGKTMSCGCFRRATTSNRTKKDLTGKTFGRLFVIKEVGRTNRRNILWECLCVCGKIHIVNSIYLLNGDVTSCGCKFKELCGESSPHWKGGLSNKGYCDVWLDTSYKTFIKERDNNTCQNPYCFKSDTILHIHHIDYDKQNCQPNNLITVCRTCNSRANTDRNWHMAWYQTIMYNKYRYIYGKYN